MDGQQTAETPPLVRTSFDGIFNALHGRHGHCSLQHHTDCCSHLQRPEVAVSSSGVGAQHLLWDMGGHPPMLQTHIAVPQHIELLQHTRQALPRCTDTASALATRQTPAAGMTARNRACACCQDSAEQQTWRAAQPSWAVRLAASIVQSHTLHSHSSPCSHGPWAPASALPVWWLQVTHVDPAGPAQAQHRPSTCLCATCTPSLQAQPGLPCHSALRFPSHCLTCLTWSIVPCRCSASGFIMKQKGLAL